MISSEFAADYVLSSRTSKQWKLCEPYIVGSVHEMRCFPAKNCSDIFAITDPSRHIPSYVTVLRHHPFISSIAHGNVSGETCFSQAPAGLRMP